MSGALYVLIGPSGSGKSTWARERFKPSEIVCADEYREKLTGDICNQSQNGAVFEIVHKIIQCRLQEGLVTVADETNCTAKSRSRMLQIAKQYHAMPVAVLFQVTLDQLYRTFLFRGDRGTDPYFIDRQYNSYQNITGPQLSEEGFGTIIVVDGVKSD